VSRGEGRLQESGEGSVADHCGRQGLVHPSAVTRSAYKHQRRNGAVTELAELPGCGHSLTIDAGWREVAETALGFIRRFE
jgi:hypothetical protein